MHLNDIILADLYQSEMVEASKQGFKRQDLIKIGFGKVGVVLQDLHDSYRILNEQNREVVISKMQCEQKINSIGTKCKTDKGDEFQKDSIVTITSGLYKVQ